MTDRLLKRLVIKNFSLFREARFDFVPGINVFIGENATGKTHLLKLIYAMLKPFEGSRHATNEHPIESKSRFNKKLLGVFRPDDDDPRRLVSSLNGARTANARLDYDGKLFVDFEIDPGGKVRPLRRSHTETPKSLFIPPREALAMYEGFVSAYENRELAFDETYYDLCKALSATPLRGKAKNRVGRLLGRLEEMLNGRLKKRGGKFYLEESAGRELEATLLAEGLRKVATLHRLIANGSLGPGSVLLIDEPEASLNPRWVTRIVDMLIELAKQNIQVFVSTHDFLVSQELSLAAEYKTAGGVPMRFFALSRREGMGVVVEPANTLADLEGNAILSEFAAHYDREQSLVSRRLSKRGE